LEEWQKETLLLEDYPLLKLSGAPLLFVQIKLVQSQEMR
ncbi:unnamed protein product, partial [marine sediment metagenome]